MASKFGTVRKTDAQWQRFQTLSRIRLAQEGFANRTDAVKRGQRVKRHD